MNNYLIFTDRDWQALWKMLPIIAIPFLGIGLMQSIGEFQLDDTIYPKSVWLWLTIAFMWGYIFHAITRSEH